MKRRPSRGLSLIDVVIGSALFALVFLALIGLMRSSLLVASLAKAKAGATAVANTQMEYIRSFPYDSVGTVGGIPAGSIAQYSTTTENGISYGVRTFIEYVDDPADGLGSSDSNGITTDYKKIKVTVSYVLKGELRSIAIVSNYVPPSIETDAGGGTLRVNVVDSTGSPVSGATVHIVNSGLFPGVDLTTFSDIDGTVLLGGAPTSTEYQVYVSKSGYSSAQTYARDATNQNPTPGYLTVVENVTTTGTFAIDALGNMTLSTFKKQVATSTTDTFTDTSLISDLTNTQDAGGSIVLAGDSSAGYASSGTVASAYVTPAHLISWTTASTTLAIPGSTALRVQVVAGNGTLIPDSQIPGNSTGFNGTSIDLSGISTSTYPTLGLVGTLTTSDASTTPSLQSWALNSLVGPIPVANVSYTLSGAKTIGSTGAGAPIFKTTVDGNTGTTGSNTENLEWDSYGFLLSGYDVTDACAAPPFAVAPGASYSNSLYLGTKTANSILVSVKDSTGAYIGGATVLLSRPGFSQTVITSACGTAYFGGLSSANDYSIEISKSGYTTTTSTNAVVSGQTFYATSFP